MGLAGPKQIADSTGDLIVSATIKKRREILTR